MECNADFYGFFSTLSSPSECKDLRRNIFFPQQDTHSVSGIVDNL